MNCKIPNYFGEHYHIEGSMPYEKHKKKSFFEYNAFNNIWMDLKKFMLQWSDYMEPVLVSVVEKSYLC